MCDLSGINNLAVGKVITLECRANEGGIMQGFTAPSPPNASSTASTWENMTNYVGQREQFVGNCCPQNEAQNETHCTKVLKMFSTDELAELIVHETNA